MNNEDSKSEIRFFSKEWLKECFSFENKKRGYDILVFLLNATWGENKDWICFVMLNNSEVFGIKNLDINEEEKRIDFLWLFFLMRKINYFDYSEEVLEKLLKREYLELFRRWKELEENLKKDWENFIDGFDKYPQHPKLWEGGRSIKFSLAIKKRKLRIDKNEKKIRWQEWETLSKASFAYDFDLLGEIICETISYFSKKKEIEELSANEDNKFETEFDIDPENVPDILITSEKSGKKMWIEVVEVHSCSLKVTKEGRKESFINFIQDQLDKKIMKSIKKRGETKLESIKNWIKIEGIKIADIKIEGNKIIIWWGIPKELDNINSLMKNLKETIEEKNKKWEEREKKSCKDLERTAIWVVLSTSFAGTVCNKIYKGQILTGKEDQEKFIYLYLLEKVYETLKNTEIKFGSLIITFLNPYYSDKKCFLDKHDPWVNINREKLKGKEIYEIRRSDFIKDSLPEFLSEVIIPNLYIPIVNNRIADPTDFIKERKRKLEEEWEFGDVDLWEYEEIPSCYTLKLNVNKKI